MTTSRLGGWWRLWIAVSALWVLVFGWDHLNQLPDLGLAIYRLDRGADDSAELLADQRLPIDPSVADWDRVAAHGRLKAELADSIREANRETNRMIATSSHRTAMIDWWMQLLRTVFVPPLILLALGLTLRWIWRGFAKGGA